MTERTASCDFERLRLLLANELPPEVEAETTDHVAACPSCRKKLELLAGDQDWWTEVKTCFGENASSIDSNGASDASQESHISNPAIDDDSFTVDFTVDFLEPCEQPETLGRIAPASSSNRLGYRRYSQ